MYLYAQFALFSRFGQSMVDTLCLHNNTSNDLYRCLLNYIELILVVLKYTELTPIYLAHICPYGSMLVHMDPYGVMY